MKKILKIVSALALSLVMCLSMVFAEQSNGNDSNTAPLTDGVNILVEGASGLTYNIDEGKVVMIKGGAEKPIIFKDCTFNLSGKTIKVTGNQQGISYPSGEMTTKLFVGNNVQFDNCTFLSENGEKISPSGNDACIYFYSGDIILNGCTLTGRNYQGQFLGLYGSTGSVTFHNSNISTVGNTGGWSYAMYGHSVLKLNNSTMTATGMKRAVGGGNVNAFYSGDLSTNYDAVYVNNSTIDFSDNYGGGFAINRVNIYVNNSKIKVNNNAGNATNSGIWYVDNSTIQMNGNRTHGWSHIADHVKNSTIEILHNGYAGYYITSDSDMTNSQVNIRCNGERYLSYSAGDVWLNTHVLDLKDCESVWLGAVGRKGTVNVENCPYVVAYDLFENKTKGNTEPVLTGIELSEQDEHILFLNPSKDFDYARGDTEGEADPQSNDADLFEDADLDKGTVIGKDSAKIKALTTAQLSHHKYDWENGIVTDQANEDCYGVKRFACVDVCADHINQTNEHANSFNCNGTYVYAPLVGVRFDVNVEDDSITNIPDDQNEIDYQGNAVKPSDPIREGYTFVGWYNDKECKNEFDFSSKLENNWTVLYAKWEKTVVDDTPTPSDPKDDITVTPDPKDDVPATPIQKNDENKEEKVVETGDSALAEVSMMLLGVSLFASLSLKKKKQI